MKRKTGGSFDMQPRRVCVVKSQEQKDAEKLTRFMDIVGGPGNAEQLKQRFDSLNASGVSADKLQADGILLSLITQSCTHRMLTLYFGAGGSRLQRIVKHSQDPGLALTKRVAAHALPEYSLIQFKQFMESLEFEDGFPCAHRRARKYLKTNDDMKMTWVYFHAMYITFICGHEDYSAGSTKYMAMTTFIQYVKKHYVGFKFERSKEDVCDRCMRLKIELQDPGLSEEDRLAKQAELKTHLEDAANQRRAKKQFIQLFCKDSGGMLTLSDDKFVEVLDVDCDLQKSDEQEQGQEVNDDQNPNCNVMILAEDFGGSLTLPHYGKERPQVDYFNSNLILNNFVVSNITSGQNLITFYDERAQGKDGNAMCSLRLSYHLGEMQSNKEVLLCVLDNCVGQNKSQVTMRFAALLSVLFYKKVALLYLQPGHSHMMADRAVAWMKTKIQNSQLYLPHQFVDAVNSVNTLCGQFINHEDPLRPCFTGWEALLERFFQKMPVGFTGCFFFEFSDGVVSYRELCTSANQEVKDLNKNMEISVLRQQLSKDLFGTTVKSDWSLSRVLLPRLPQQEIAEKKIKSLSLKYASIPQQYKSYYPTIPQQLLQENVQNKVATRAENEAVQKAINSNSTKKDQIRRGPGRPKLTLSDKLPSNQQSLLSFLKFKQ
ncbi:hypothetical protein MP228_006226 [Amoeboaphelidium protococcarum]|nr:hypothetical protein MP228_006226 [Amoeboaphelidium protococcarum]